MYDLFNFRNKHNQIQQYNPIIIENQNPKVYVHTYDVNAHDLAFTLPKAKEPCPEKPHDKKSIQEDIIWQITVELHKSDSNSIECHRAYFKLNEDYRTKVDLRNSFDENEVAWIRIQGYDNKNPQRRAWFQVIKGPMFGKINCKFFS